MKQPELTRNYFRDWAESVLANRDLFNETQIIVAENILKVVDMTMTLEELQLVHDALDEIRPYIRNGPLDDRLYAASAIISREITYKKRRCHYAPDNTTIHDGADARLCPKCKQDQENAPMLCGKRAHIDGAYFGPCSYEKGKCPDHDQEPSR